MPDIYTRRGDDGRTDLWGSDERVSKASERIDAYGTVDELIAFLGHAAVHAADSIADDLEHVQHRLHVVMARLADADSRGDTAVTEEDVAWVEDRVDAYQEELPELDAFILPGGSHAGALLHLGRTVCRRAERRIVDLAEDEPVDDVLRMYVNRLSDLLFVMARFQNRADGEAETRVDYDD